MRTPAPGTLEGTLRLALLGFGNVGKAFVRLLDAKRTSYPFRIVGIHTARHGTAYSERGVSGAYARVMQPLLAAE